MRLPGAAWVLSRALQLGVVQRQPTAYGWLSKRGIPADIIASYVRPIYASVGIRRDAQRFIGAVDNKYTRAAALPAFAEPVMLIRAADDKLFRPDLFDRLGATLPDARLVTVPDSYTFVSEDQPASLVVDCTQRRSGTPN